MDPERVLIGKESIQGLIEALNGLHEETRDTFLLCRLEHMTHRELAELYGISVSAVEKRIAKALAHIAMRASRP